MKNLESVFTIKPGDENKVNFSLGSARLLTDIDKGHKRICGLYNHSVYVTSYKRYPGRIKISSSIIPDSPHPRIHKQAAPLAVSIKDICTRTRPYRISSTVNTIPKWLVMEYLKANIAPDVLTYALNTSIKVKLGKNMYSKTIIECINDTASKVHISQEPIDYIHSFGDMERKLVKYLLTIKMAFERTHMASIELSFDITEPNFKLAD